MSYLLNREGIVERKKKRERREKGEKKKKGLSHYPILPGALVSLLNARSSLSVTARNSLFFSWPTFRVVCH